MKKFLTLTLAIAMILTMGSISAFAANITTNPGSDTGEVYGTYVAGSGAATMYSVNVSWQALEFTYTGASAGTWNPAQHNYTGATPAAWSSTTNNITVTNHSNTGVGVAFSYAPVAAYNTISGLFSGTGVTSDAATLPSAVGKATDDTLLSVTAALTLDGELDSGTADSTQIGTVTVTIS